MGSETKMDEETADQRLDLEVIDLDEPRDANDSDTGFGSGGGGSSASCGSSSGCAYWIDDTDPSSAQ
jgi:hypothetical protein